MTPPTSAHEQIRNTIASVALSFDTNNFPHLANSFTPNASADYVGSLGLLQGIEDIITGLQKAIGHVTTFHALSTQAIHLASNGDTAEATTYVSASHYLGDKSFFAKARYFDKLLRVVDGEEEGGEGKWLIESRYVTMVGVPRGDVSIFGLELDEWVGSLKA
jgi:hypothetical protein